MDLNQMQLDQLRAYLIENGIRYRDVQYELLDHLASHVEEQVNSSETMDIYNAFEKVKLQFSTSELQTIVKNKEKSLSQYWNKNITALAISYLSWPKIWITVILFFIGFQNMFLSQIFIAILMMAIIATIFYKSYEDRSSSTQYLSVKSYHNVLMSFIALISWIPFWFILSKANLDYVLVQGSVALLFAFMFIFLHGFVWQFPQKIKKQMDETNKYLVWS